MNAALSGSLGVVFDGGIRPPKEVASDVHSCVSLDPIRNLSRKSCTDASTAILLIHTMECDAEDIFMKEVRSSITLRPYNMAECAQHIL